MKMPSTVVTVRVAPQMAELPTLVGFIEAFAEAQGLGAADTFAITLASEELFTNTLHHSEPGAAGIGLCLQRDADDTVTITYSDDGSAFDPTRQAEPDTSLPAAERSLGGLGIHMIRKSMESFTYHRDHGLNRVTFVRRLTR